MKHSNFPVAIFLVGIVLPAMANGIVTCRADMSNCRGSYLPAPSDTWHLLARSVSGTVSLISHLSKDECDKITERLLLRPDLGPSTPYKKLHDGTTVGRMWAIAPLDPGDIEMVECFE